MNTSVPFPRPPREVRLRDSYLDARRLWAVVTVAGGVISLLLLVSYARELLSLAQHGVGVTGRVVDTRITSGKSDSFHMTVEFNTPQGQQDRDFTVTSVVYGALTKGGPVELVYDATNPQNVVTQRVTEGDAKDEILKWSAGWVLSGLFVIFAFWSDSRGAAVQTTKLQNWEYASLQVQTVKSYGSRTELLAVSGDYVNFEGKSVSVTGLTVSSHVQLDVPMKILYDPAGSGVIAYENLGKVELATPKS